MTFNRAQVNATKHQWNVFSRWLSVCFTVLPQRLKTQSYSRKAFFCWSVSRFDALPSSQKHTTPSVLIQWAITLPTSYYSTNCVLQGQKIWGRLNLWHVISFECYALDLCRCWRKICLFFFFFKKKRSLMCFFKVWGTLKGTEEDAPRFRHIDNTVLKTQAYWFWSYINILYYVIS